MNDRALRRSADRLRWAVIVVMAMLALALLLARLNIPVGQFRIEVRPHLPSVQAPPAVADVHILLLEIALFRLTQMLAAIASGDMFSAKVVGRFRGFAFWLLLMALFSFGAPIVAKLVAGPADRTNGLAVAFYLREVLTVGVTLVLFLVARLLERAREIEDEMREIV